MRKVEHAAVLVKIRSNESAFSFRCGFERTICNENIQKEVLQMKKQILLVDGMALLFRGFYATAYRGNFMKTSQGVPTNGVYQFLHYFFNAVHTFKPTHVICCWDMGKKTFRNDLFHTYKANRAEPPEELVPQFELAKDVMEAFNVPNIGMENFEADDCIGTLAHHYAPEHEVTILTGDQDILQLVSEGIRVAILKKGQGNYDLFDHSNFYKKKESFQGKSLI